MAEAAEISIEIEGEPLSLDSQLQECNWYIGHNTTTEAALLILRECSMTNCFVVYRQPMEEDYTISMKTIPTGTNVNMYEHLRISAMLTGQYTIHGPKMYSSNNFLKLIDNFSHGFLPPLLPAVGVSVTDLTNNTKRAQLNPTDKECKYEFINFHRKYIEMVLNNALWLTLQYDMYSLFMKPALSVQVSGSSLISASNDNKKLLTGSYITSPTTGSVKPQWKCHEDKSPTHPQNLCYGCCYRRQKWNGSMYSPTYSWYDVRGNGPLRLVGLIAFWLTCGACFSIYRGIKYATVVVSHVCCNLYDDEE